MLRWEHGLVDLGAMEDVQSKSGFGGGPYKSMLFKIYKV